MPNTLTEKEERQMVTAVEKTAAFVDTGNSPTEALEKVARSEQFGPGRIRLVAHAYNTGRQLHQWRSKTALEKLASYDLIDPEEIIGRLFGTQKQAEDEVSSEYQRPPVWAEEKQRTKVASDYQFPRFSEVTVAADPAQQLHQAFAVVSQNKKVQDELSRQKSAAEDQVKEKIASLIGYFSQSPYDRLPFAAVESAANTYYGDAATPLLALVYQHAHLQEKRAQDLPPLLTAPLNLNAQPFPLIVACIKAAEACNDARQALLIGQEKAAAAEAAAFLPFARPAASSGPGSKSSVLPSRESTLTSACKQANWGAEVAAIATGDILAHKATVKPHEEEDPYGDVSEINDDLKSIADKADAALQAKKPKLTVATDKEAFIGGPATGAVLGGMLGRTIGSTPKTKDDLVEDAWIDLEDPQHQNELRKIKAHAMLTDMMTDPDDPISSHDHDKVLKAYNEISQISPRAAEHAASLRPLLRKRLEGHAEPFEIKEMTDIEKGLHATRGSTPNTQLLNDSPERILG